MALALPELLVLAALLLALGICYSGKAFAESLIWVINNTVGKVPLIGGWVGGKAGASLQAMANRMGSYADKIGAQVAGNWHFLATVVDRTGWAIFHTNVALEKLFWHITAGYPLHVMWKVAHDALRIAQRGVHATAGVNQAVTIVVKEAGHPGSTALGKAIRSAIAVAVKPLRIELKQDRARLAALEASIASVGDVAMPVPSVGVEAWKGALARIRARLSKLENGALPIIGVGAIAVALSRLGLGFMRCTNVKRTARQICRTDPALLDTLLASLAVIVGAQSVVRFANFALEAEGEMVGVLERMIVELEGF